MIISLTYNTKTKQAEIKKDGKAIDNLESLSLHTRYSEDDKLKYYLDMTELSEEKNKDDNTFKTVRTNTSASLCEALVQNFPVKGE